MVPIAAFLAGALLTLLLPVAILIALSVWYWVFSVRVPENAASPGPGATTTPEATPAHELAPVPGPDMAEFDPAHSEGRPSGTA